MEPSLFDGLDGRCAHTLSGDSQFSQGLREGSASLPRPTAFARPILAALAEVQAKPAAAKMAHKPNMRTFVVRGPLVHSSRA
jgi:hypothetical protein